MKQNTMQKVAEYSTPYAVVEVGTGGINSSFYAGLLQHVNKTELVLIGNRIIPESTFGKDAIYAKTRTFLKKQLHDASINQRIIIDLERIISVICPEVE